MPSQTSSLFLIAGLLVLAVLETEAAAGFPAGCRRACSSAKAACTAEVAARQQQATQSCGRDRVCRRSVRAAFRRPRHQCAQLGKACPALTCPAPASPLDFALTLDGGRAVRATIGRPGGTLAATAADGTRVTLTIPPDALPEEVEISMTPIAAIEDLSERFRLGGGVQLEPEGLRLFQLATLTVEPAISIPVPREVSLGWHAEGEHVYRTPLLPSAASPTFFLDHFSGYAALTYVGDGIWIPDEDIPRSPITEDQLKQMMEDILRQERKRVMDGQEPDPKLFEKLEEGLATYYWLFLKDSLEAGMQNCSIGREVLPKAFGWARQVRLIGAENLAPEAEFVEWEASTAIIDTCWRELVEPCVDWADTEKIQRTFSLMRQATLLGTNYDIFSRPHCVPRAGWRGTIQIVKESAFHEEGTEYGGSYRLDVTRRFAVNLTVRPEDLLSGPGVEGFWLFSLPTDVNHMTRWEKWFDTSTYCPIHRHELVVNEGVGSVRSRLRIYQSLSGALDMDLSADEDLEVREQQTLTVTGCNSRSEYSEKIIPRTPFPALAASLSSDTSTRHYVGSVTIGPVWNVTTITFDLERVDGDTE